jgi:hypothetical protein
MTEELISFKTAKLAKEKGLTKLFNTVHYIPCYNGDVTDVKRYGILDEYQGEDEILIDWVYLAVTQSLLQKWLRDIHKINAIPQVSKRSEDNKFYGFFSGDVIIYETDKSLDTIFRYFKTYEQALEAGLYQALLLIK